jgi:hypothetical protein
MEYLAPGVYVEEVSSGNKPIEGASTSTAGMVGVTQRGPVNEPILVTSSGDFNRLFGGVLDHRTFTENRDALPYAAFSIMEVNVCMFHALLALMPAFLEPMYMLRRLVVLLRQA